MKLCSRCSVLTVPLCSSRYQPWNDHDACVHVSIYTNKPRKRFTLRERERQRETLRERERDTETLFHIMKSSPFERGVDHLLHKASTRMKSHSRKRAQRHRQGKRANLQEATAHSEHQDLGLSQ